MIDARRLLDAAALVEHAIRQANTITDNCKCCGFKRHRNWNETQGSKEMTAVIRKLRMWAERIDTAEGNDDDG